MSCGVLVVEDDSDLREMMSQILAMEGFRPTTAENGLTALHKLDRESKPDVIVLDLMMPVMDGWQFRAVQRSRPELVSIPVIVVSAVTETAGSIGAAAVLRKPIDIDEFVRVVRRHC